MPHHYLTEQAQDGGGGVLPGRLQKRMKALRLDGSDLVFDDQYDEASLGVPKVARKPSPKAVSQKPPRAFIRPL